MDSALCPPFVPRTPRVKMCGVTSPEDAAAAAAAGAEFVGMILWPKSKRSVSFPLGKDIAEAARQHGATPVGVFVDEDAATIFQACQATTVRVAQLHGDGARSAFPHLRAALDVIYVAHADQQGHIKTPLPPSTVDWLLIDGLHGGSGEAYQWNNLKAPEPGATKHGWMLAGGLHPGNVCEALAVVKPQVVDVSSGITGADGIRKDKQRIQAFMDAVRSSGCRRHVLRLHHGLHTGWSDNLHRCRHNYRKLYAKVVKKGVAFILSWVQPGLREQPECPEAAVVYCFHATPRVSMLWRSLWKSAFPGLLYNVIVFQQGSNCDLLFSRASARAAQIVYRSMKDKAGQHALYVRGAVAMGNYHSFFRLYRTAPNLNPCLMDLHVEKTRFTALLCKSRANRPSLSITFISLALGFSSTSSVDGEYRDIQKEQKNVRSGLELQIVNEEGSSWELVMDAEEAQGTRLLGSCLDFQGNCTIPCELTSDQFCLKHAWCTGETHP